MKLGIFMLVFGLIIAGAGLTTWMLGISGAFCLLRGHLDTGGIQIVHSGGIGAAVIGGGLAVGGIVGIVLKR